MQWLSIIDHSREYEPIYFLITFVRGSFCSGDSFSKTLGIPVFSGKMVPPVKQTPLFGRSVFPMLKYNASHLATLPEFVSDKLLSLYTTPGQGKGKGVNNV